MSFAPMNLTPSLTGCCPGRTKYPPPSLTTNLADMQPSWQGLPCPAPPPQSKSPYPAWGFNAFNHVNANAGVTPVQADLAGRIDMVMPEADRSPMVLALLATLLQRQDTLPQGPLAPGVAHRPPVALSKANTVRA
ncbi:hypothetical protein PtB15_8B219 [Puccinia triticina]|nr:hypothetical protein PtB15_8B219 [Puccinia triticina]